MVFNMGFPVPPPVEDIDLDEERLNNICSRKQVLGRGFLVAAKYYVGRCGSGARQGRRVQRSQASLVPFTAGRGANSAAAHTRKVFGFAPFGKSLGIKNSRPKKDLNKPKLETAYRTSPTLKHEQKCALAKELDLTERQVERWWRLRRSQDKPSTLVKFCEDAWRSTYLLYSFSFGTFILWDKEWLWDIDHCYIGYPHQGITSDVWWYYMVSCAFYWSLMLSQFWDVRRKDFWQTFVHHLATIMLFAFSWVCNFHRIGTLVILSHECSEIFLAVGKAAKYAGYQKLCDSVFALFTVLWIVTRLGVYPFYIIWSFSASIRAPMLFPLFPAYYIFILLLYLLLALHVFWTWLILQLAYKSIIAGQMEGDIRSSSSEASDSSHNSNHSTPNRVNHKKET